MKHVSFLIHILIKFSLKMEHAASILFHVEQNESLVTVRVFIHILLDL